MRTWGERLPLAFAIVVLLAFPSARSGAREVWGWLSPGIKIAFTMDGKVSAGIEVSTTFPTYTAPGVVLNFDTNFDGQYKFRLGGQIGTMGLPSLLCTGVETGPTWIIYRGEHYFGWGLTPWFGAIFLPFYTVTWIQGPPENTHEWGTYIKWPMIFSNEGIYPFAIPPAQG